MSSCPDCRGRTGRAGAPKTSAGLTICCFRVLAATPCRRCGDPQHLGRRSGFSILHCGARPSIAFSSPHVCRARWGNLSGRQRWVSGVQASFCRRSGSLSPPFSELFSATGCKPCDGEITNLWDLRELSDPVAVSRPVWRASSRDRRWVVTPRSHSGGPGRGFDYRAANTHRVAHLPISRLQTSTTGRSHRAYKD